MEKIKIEELLEKYLLSVNEVASILSVSNPQVHLLIRDGKLEAINVSTKTRPHMRIKSESVKKLLKLEEPQEQALQKV